MSHVLIPAKEALRRCGYRGRNSLPALCKKLGVKPIVRNRRNYFSEADIDRYLQGLIDTLDRPVAVPNLLKS